MIGYPDYKLKQFLMKQAVGLRKWRLCQTPVELCAVSQQRCCLLLVCSNLREPVLVAHQIIGEEYEKLLLEELVFRQELCLEDSGAIFERITIRQRDLHAQVVGGMRSVAQEEDAGGRKFQPVGRTCRERFLERDGEVVFDHPDHHIGVRSALTLHVVDLVLQMEDGIIDHCASQSLMLLTELDNVSIQGVASAEDLIDQGDQELRRFLDHGLEDGIIDCVVSHGEDLFFGTVASSLPNPRRLWKAGIPACRLNCSIHGK